MTNKHGVPMSSDHKRVRRSRWVFFVIGTLPLLQPADHPTKDRSSVSTDGASDVGQVNVIMTACFSAAESR
jgi:hypothetical protein